MGEWDGSREAFGVGFAGRRYRSASLISSRDGASASGGRLATGRGGAGRAPRGHGREGESRCDARGTQDKHTRGGGTLRVERGPFDWRVIKADHPARTLVWVGSRYVRGCDISIATV
jgi:hypothetical protein